MYTIHEEKYRGYTIEIMPDDYPESPREWDNLGTMYYRHRGYILGDQEIPESYYSDKLGDTVYIDSAESFSDWIEETQGQIAVMLPLAIYDHSGVTMWCGSRWSGIDPQWDCSDVGFIVVTKEKIREEYGVKRISKQLLDKVEKILQAEVETFDQYLTGDVYGFSVTDESGEEINSCCGFYGQDDCIAEAKSIIDWTIKDKQKQHLQQLKQYISSNVPIDYRFTS